MTQLSASTLEPFAPAIRRFALLWLVVALLFQGFVTQTHGHIGTDTTWATAATARAAPAAVDSRKNSPATPVCPLCEERALFGAYLLGGSIAIAAPAQTVFHYATTALSSLALGASSHAWQSRAPPIFTA